MYTSCVITWKKILVGPKPLPATQLLLLWMINHVHWQWTVLSDGVFNCRCFGLCWGNREGHYPSTDRKETKRNSKWIKYCRRIIYCGIHQYFSNLLKSPTQRHMCPLVIVSFPDFPYPLPPSYSQVLFKALILLVNILYATICAYALLPCPYNTLNCSGLLRSESLGMTRGHANGLKVGLPTCAYYMWFCATGGTNKWRQPLFATIAKPQFFSYLQTAMLDEERERNRELRTQIERLQNRVCSNTADAQTHGVCECRAEKYFTVQKISHFRASQINCEPVLGHCKHLCTMHVKYTQLVCILASQALSN